MIASVGEKERDDSMEAFHWTQIMVKAKLNYLKNFSFENQVANSPSSRKSIVQTPLKLQKYFIFIPWLRKSPGKFLILA